MFDFKTLTIFFTSYLFFYNTLFSPVSPLNIICCEIKPGGSVFVNCEQAEFSYSFGSAKEMFQYCELWGAGIVDPHDSADLVTKVYLAKAKEASENYLLLQNKYNSSLGFLEKFFSKKSRVLLENTKNQFLLLLLDSKIEKKEVIFLRNKNFFGNLPTYQQLNINEPVLQSLLSVFEMILSEESILLNNNERQKFFSNLIEEIGKEQLSFSEQRLMRRISVYFNQLIDTTSFGFKK
jgi:hypothetical protein